MVKILLFNLSHNYGEGWFQPQQHLTKLKLAGNYKPVSKYTVITAIKISCEELDKVITATLNSCIFQLLNIIIGSIFITEIAPLLVVRRDSVSN